jgi:hypothetical protein
MRFSEASYASLRYDSCLMIVRERERERERERDVVKGA